MHEVLPGYLAWLVVMYSGLRFRCWNVHAVPHRKKQVIEALRAECQRLTEDAGEQDVLDVLRVICTFRRDGKRMLSFSIWLRGASGCAVLSLRPLPGAFPRAPIETRTGLIGSTMLVAPQLPRVP